MTALAGVTIANLARRFVKGRRSRWLNLLFGASIILGALPTILVLGVGGGFLLFATAQSGGSFLSNIFALGPLLWQIVYLAMATPAAYSQFSGLFLRK